MFRSENYIGGQWIKTKDQIDVYNPADGKVIGTVPKAGKKEAKQLSMRQLRLLQSGRQRRQWNGASCFAAGIN